MSRAVETSDGKKSILLEQLPNNVLNEIAKRVSNPAAFIQSSPVFAKRYMLPKPDVVRITPEHMVVFKDLEKNKNKSFIKMRIKGTDAHRLESICSASTAKKPLWNLKDDDDNAASAASAIVFEKMYYDDEALSTKSDIPNKSFRIIQYKTINRIYYRRMPLEHFHCTIPNNRNFHNFHNFEDWQTYVLPDTNGYTNLVLLVFKYFPCIHFVLRGKDEAGIHVQIHVLLEKEFAEQEFAEFDFEPCLDVTICAHYGRHMRIETGWHLARVAPDPIDRPIDDFADKDVTCAPCDQLRKLLDIKKILFENLAPNGYNITSSTTLTSIQTDISDAFLDLEHTSSTTGPIVFVKPQSIAYRSTKKPTTPLTNNKL
jgi:hypothetical protein